MTPEHLAELQVTWPGEWTPCTRDHIPDPYQLRVPPSAEWSINAFTIDATHGPTHYIDACSQDRDAHTVYGSGKSFAEAKAWLSVAIAYHTEQLATLSRMVP